MRMLKPNSAISSSYLKIGLLSIGIIFPLTFAQQHIVENQLQVSFWLIPFLVILLMVFIGGRLLKKLEVQQSESQLFRAITDFSLEFTYIRSVDGTYEYVSPAVESITGYSVEEFYAQPNFMDTLVCKDDKCSWVSHLESVNSEGDPERLEICITTKAGEIRWLEHLCGPIHNEKGRFVGVRSINVDITEQKLANLELERMGYYDPLTNLPNRRYLNNHLNDLIKEIETNQTQQQFAVIFIDLVRFKYVNDAHGHSVGDMLLQEVAKRFNSSCMDCQQAIISRFGGDEFVLVNKLSTTMESIQNCVERINKLLEEPFEILGHRLSIGATCGVALYPNDGLSPELLLKNADAAMFKAKSQSLSMAFFSPEMAEHATEMVAIQAKLRKAIEKNEIQPYYQPLVDLKSGEVIGVEVLARWIDDSQAIQGTPSPAVFIPVAEETGLIWALSESMIEQAGQQILQWQREGLKLNYSINVSARQFADENFCDNAIAHFKSLGIDIGSVQIELTESVLINNIERSIEKISYLRQQGFRIALDDFGTGFASLQYLTMFPLDTLKVDRAFVKNILQDHRQFAIAKSIINLAKDLDLKVVAEGIETEAQKLLLKSLGCDIGQGFLFSKPVPPNVIEALLESRSAA